MAGFIYAIDNVGAVTAELLTEFGLSGIVDVGNLTQRQSGRGPGGTGCVLFMTNTEARLVFYKPDSQTWQKSNNGKYWVGFYNDDKPGELVLRRQGQLAGHFVELGNGEKWLIPVARILAGGSRLPQSLILGKDGEVVGEEMPKYAKFSSDVEKLWEDFQVEAGIKTGEAKLTVADRMRLAIDALAWNYHVGVDEVNLLKLITTQNLISVMEAILDIPTLIEVSKEATEQKKNVSPAGTNDGCSISSGGGDF